MLKVSLFVVLVGVTIVSGCALTTPPPSDTNVPPVNTTTSSILTATTTQGVVSSTANNNKPEQKQKLTDKQIHSALVGEWSGGTFEEIDLSANGEFTSFIQDHPGYSGGWDVENSLLTIMSDEGVLFNYKNIVFANSNTITMYEVDTGEVETWHRIVR